MPSHIAMTSAEKNASHFRTVKSYVVRGGRLTSSQQQAMETLWSQFGLELEQGIIDQKKIFSRHAELVLEIGFGMGESLIAMARQNPRQDFVAIDVHPPGIGTLLRAIKENDLQNIRLYKNDAKIILDECFADNSIDKIQIFFPDPWQKKRHHKRRLIQPEFVQRLRTKLKVGGLLHLVTDWENYSGQMLQVLSAAKGFANTFGQGQFASEHDRPKTKFERRGERLGHGVWDLIFKKTG